MSDLRIIPAEEAKALREKATQGPWAKSDSEFERSDIRTADQRLWIAMTGDEHEQSGEREEADRELIVSAPDLAWTVEQQEAKIERVREELEELRDTLSKARIDIARGDYELGQHTAFLLASSQITRILEGEQQ